MSDVIGSNRRIDKTGNEYGRCSSKEFFVMGGRSPFTYVIAPAKAPKDTPVDDILALN